MRILILSNIDPYCIGGAEVQARLLAESFTDLGHSVTVAGYAVPNGRICLPGKKYLTITSVHLSTLRVNRIARALTFFCSLGRFLIRHRSDFDVIYCRMIGESALVASLLRACHFIRPPLVACSECRGDVGDAAFLRSLPFTGLLVRLLSRQCAAINVLSPDIEAELKAIGLNTDRFVHIPNGVSVPQQSGPVRKKGHDIFSFLFVGRLVPVKGVAELLRAARLLVDWQIPVRINIVGQGPLENQLVQLSQALGIEKQVCFHGPVPHHRIKAHYEANEFFVLPSHHEGQGVVVAEAMGFGVPVVATKSGGPEYMVDAAVGRICKAGDPVALASAMAELCRLPENRRNEMANTARQRVAARYNICTIAENYLKLFYNLQG